MVQERADHNGRHNAMAEMQRVVVIMFALLFITLNAAHCTESNDGVEFDTYEWDFGQIDEHDGEVRHTFVLTNASGKPLRITNAIPSCSCISASFTRNAIGHGEKGMVEVCFSPSGAHGKVYREVQVLNGDNESIATLQITADVIPADRSIAERYAFTLMPFLYANRNNVPFGYVFHGKEKTKTVYLANASAEKMHISIANASKMLTIECPETLHAGEEAELLLTYHTPDADSLYAFVEDTLYLNVDGTQTVNPIVTSMIALPTVVNTDNTAMLRTYPSAPILEKKGDSYIATMELHSDGTEDIVINAIQLPAFASCNIKKGEIISHGTKRILEIKTTAKQEFTMHIFTNDPQRPMKDVSIRF